MTASALITKLPFADQPRDCEAKSGCKSIAHFSVVVREGASCQFKYLCQSHADCVAIMAKTGTLTLHAATKHERPSGPPPVAPPAVMPSGRPRITFPLPKDPLIAICKSCAAEIIWINHPRTHSLMPVNASGDRQGESHHATCPNAHLHRKTK